MFHDGMGLVHHVAERLGGVLNLAADTVGALGQRDGRMLLMGEVGCLALDFDELSQCLLLLSIPNGIAVEDGVVVAGDLTERERDALGALEIGWDLAAFCDQDIALPVYFVLFHTLLLWYLFVVYQLFSLVIYGQY